MDQIQARFPHWDIVRLMTGIPWPYPPDGALTYCRDVALPQMERGEAWHWTIRPKDQVDEIIGAISLFAHALNNRGLWVSPSWQGRGLAGEAVDAVTAYWFDVLQFPVLRVAKAIDNVPSRRLSVRQRMRIVSTEEREYVSGRHPSEVWEITVDEWRSSRRSIEPHAREDSGEVV